MLIAVSRRLHLCASPLNRLSFPTDRSKRLRGWILCGLWSLSPVPGAGIVTRLELYSEARHTAGKGLPGVALTPLQLSPAWNSWSAVSPPRTTAGCPFSVVDVSAQAVFGSFDKGL